MDSIADVFEKAVRGHNHRMSRGGIKVNCPSCGETRMRGWFIRSQTGGFRYKCYNGGCEFETATGWEDGKFLSQRAQDLFKAFGGRASELPSPPRESATKQLRERRLPPPKPDIRTRFDTMALPDGSMSLADAFLKYEDAGDVAEYLNTRGACYFHADRLWRFSWSPKMPRHLIMPFYHESDQIVGYLARNIDITTGPDRFEQRSQYGYVFNQHIIRKYVPEYLFVMESPLSAIALDGLATRSTSLNTNAIELIKASGKTPILIPDMKDIEGGSYVETALNHGWRVAMLDGYKDPGESIAKNGALFTAKLILDSAKSNLTKARVRMKIS